MTTGVDAHTREHRNGTSRWADPVLIDAACILVLVALGLLSFRNLYGGIAYLLVGLLGTAIGIGISEVAVRWRKPVLTEALAGVVLFLVVGALVVARANAVGGVVPTGHSFTALAHAAIFGWKELLTTAPPVGSSSNLLAIPYLVGLVGGVSGQSLARRTRLAALPLIGPVLVLAVGILFGPRIPTSLLLQGVVFAGIALAWVTIRTERYRAVVIGGSFNRRRFAFGIGMLAVAVAIAGLIGPHLPGAGSRSRVVLSRYIVPPFDVNDQPSPLGGFRQYAENGSMNKKVLFVVKGVRPGSKMRIATMDAYNGLVWGFGAGGGGVAGVASEDAFQKFGSTIPASEPGSTVKATVTIKQLGGVWMPDVGQTTDVVFAGPKSQQLGSAYRFDSETGTAAQPLGLQPGVRYSLTAVVPRQPSNRALLAAAPGQEQLSISGVPVKLRSDATKWAGNATSPWGKVEAIAKYFKLHGKFSNGNEPIPLSAPGHTAGRLATFLQGGGMVGDQIVGDDEQYAAAMALMADAVGVPARVVLGADVEPGGVVKGSDVHAWIEVSLDGLGWVTVPSNAFLPHDPPEKNPPTRTPEQVASAPVQPPAQSAVRSPLDEQPPGTSDTPSLPAQHKHPGGPLIPAWVFTVLHWAIPPIVVVLLISGTILGIKRRRRNKRRRAARPSARIAGAWAELVDFERDRGRTVPSRETRRGQVPHLEFPKATTLAGMADAAIFGPGEPTPAEIDAYWSAVDESTASIRRTLARLERWRVALSLRSLLSTSTISGSTSRA